MPTIRCSCGSTFSVPRTKLSYRIICNQCGRKFVAQAVPELMEAPKLKLGDLAVAQGLISRKHLDHCVEYQQTVRAGTGGGDKRLGEVLVEKGLLTEEQVEHLLTTQRGDAPKVSPPPPQSEREKWLPDQEMKELAKKVPAPRTRPQAAVPRRRPAIYLAVAAPIALVVALLVVLWPAPEPQRVLSAFLQSCNESSIQPDAALCVGDLRLIVREFVIQEMLPTVHHDFAAELRAYLARNPTGAWPHFFESVDMAAGKRRAFQLIQPALPDVLTPDKVGSLRVDVQPIRCSLTFRRDEADAFAKGLCDFLVVRIHTPRWTSRWLVAGYQRIGVHTARQAVGGASG